MTSRVCADASLVLRWMLPTDQDAEAEALLKSWDETGTDIIGPPSLDAEVTSVVRGLVFTGRLLPEHGEEAYRLFRALGVSIVSPTELSDKAWRLAVELDRARTYGMQYLALAELMDCELWTADSRLFNVVKNRGNRVHTIGGKEQAGTRTPGPHKPPKLDEPGLWRAF